MKLTRSIVQPGFRYFAAVAKAGSIRAAARLLNVAASAINRQVLLLEEEHGPLFERHGRGLKLNDPGRILLKIITETEQRYDDTLTALDALKGLERGKVRVATVESVSVGLVPEILTSFRERYPGLQAVVTVAGADAVTELVRAGDADIGFTFSPDSLESLEVFFECGIAIGAVMAPDHPLARKRRLAIEECLKHEIAWPIRGLGLRGTLDLALGRKAEDIEPAFECSSLRLMATLARTGRCIAFQTRIGIEQDLKAGTLVYVPLSDSKLEPDRFMLVRQCSSEGRLAAAALLDLARDHLRLAIERKGR